MGREAASFFYHHFPSPAFQTIVTVSVFASTKRRGQEVRKGATTFDFSYDSSSLCPPLSCQFVSLTTQFFDSCSFLDFPHIQKRKREMRHMACSKISHHYCTITTIMCGQKANGLRPHTPVHQMQYSVIPHQSQTPPIGFYFFFFLERFLRQSPSSTRV